MKCSSRASCYSWLGVTLAGCCELQTKGEAITSQHTSVQCAGARLCTLGMLSSTSTLQQSLVSHISMQNTYSYTQMQEQHKRMHGKRYTRSEICLDK